MPKRTHSSKQWLDRHFNDHYVKKAQAEGWRSRAIFKLQEFQEKYRFLKPGQCVVDLGAAPGGWSQYVASILKGKGQIFALDILPMEPLDHVHFIQGDFTSDAIWSELDQLIDRGSVDVILSDIAPNMSGQRAIDQPRVMHLAELALEFVETYLSDNGIFIIKLFHGEEFDEYLKILRSVFCSVKISKPKASRQTSREVYLMAQKRKHVLS